MRKTLRKVLCVGMATVDSYLYVPVLELRSDGVTSLSETLTTVGGKGLNVAINLAILGQESMALSTIGQRRRHAKEFESVRHERLELKFLPILPRNNRTWILQSETAGTHTFVDSPSSAGDDLMIGRLELEKHKLVYLSIECPRLLESVLAQLSADAVVVTNFCEPFLSLLCGSSALAHEVIRRTNIAIQNEKETEYLLQFLGGQGGHGRPENLQLLISTRGRHGGKVYSGRMVEMYSFSSVAPATTACETGAGDAFNAAFILAYLVRKWTLEKSCQYAAAVASLKVASLGSNLVRVKSI